MTQGYPSWSSVCFRSWLASWRSLLRFGRGLLRPKASLVAENLFLNKQLAFYRERNIAPRRLTDTAKLSLLLWSRWFDWRNALMVVKPETLIGWHRRAFQIFWRRKSQGGRPRLPKNLRALIAEMVWENPKWGQARVASELALKLGVRVSPRTVRAYWPKTCGQTEVAPRNVGQASYETTPKPLWPAISWSL